MNADTAHRSDLSKLTHFEQRYTRGSDVACCDVSRENAATSSCVLLVLSTSAQSSRIVRRAGARFEARYCPPGSRRHGESRRMGPEHNRFANCIE